MNRSSSACELIIIFNNNYGTAGGFLDLEWKNGGIAMRDECIFFCTLRVRYGEVDQQGIVYNGNYASYGDFAFCEFLRSRGCSYNNLSKTLDFEVCHKASSFEFFSSAYAEDLIEIGVKIVKIGTRSFTMGYEFRRDGEDELLVYSEVVYVGYDVKNRVSRELTPGFVNLLTG